MNIRGKAHDGVGLCPPHALYERYLRALVKNRWHAQDNSEHCPRSGVIIAQDSYCEEIVTLASPKIRYYVHADNSFLLAVELPNHDIARYLVALPPSLWQEPDAHPVGCCIPLA